MAEHLAVRAMHRGNDAMLARDWSTFADNLSDAFRGEDRRLGLGSSLGKSETVEQARIVVDQGLEALDVEVVESRGDRHALFRVTGHVADFVVSSLVVLEVGAEGRVLASVSFDSEDMNGASRELEARAGA